MKLTTTILGLILLSSGLPAQNYDFTISESTMVLGGDMNNTLSIMIYESSEEEIIKAWKSLMKKQGAKVKIESEIVAQNVSLADMGNLPFNCFSSIKQIDEKTIQFNVCVYLGGSYLSFNEHPDKYKKFSAFLTDFAKNTTADAIEVQLKLAEEFLNEKESDLKKLEERKAKLEKQIETCRKAVQKAEDDIEINILEQTDKKKEVQVANEVVAKENKKLEGLKKRK